jgi:hypothetical protein
MPSIRLRLVLTGVVLTSLACSVAWVEKPANRGGLIVVGSASGCSQQTPPSSGNFSWSSKQPELDRTKAFIEAHPNWVTPINGKDDLFHKLKPGDKLKYVIMPPDPDHPQPRLRIHKSEQGDKTAHLALADPVGSDVLSAGWIQILPGGEIVFDNQSHHYHTTGDPLAKGRAQDTFNQLKIPASYKETEIWLLSILSAEIGSGQIRVGSLTRE